MILTQNLGARLLKPRSTMPKKSKLRDLVTCPICLDLLKDPRMLPCQHTFCLGCIKKFSKDSSTKFRCAQCRTEVPVPNEGVGDLPGNIFLKSVLELFSPDKAKMDRTSCGKCDTVCETKDCQHCGVNLCAICEQRHVLELENQLNNILDQLVLTKEKVACKIKTFANMCEQVKDSVHMEIQNRVRAILDVETDLVRQIDAALDIGRLTAFEVTQKVDNNANKIHQIVAGIYEADSHKTATEKISLFLEVHQESSKCLEEADGTSLGFLKFTPNSLSIEKLLQQETPPESPHCSLVSEVSSEDQTQDSLNIDSAENDHALYYRCRPFTAKARLGSVILQRPAGVAVSPWSKEMYVVSIDSHRVFVYDMQRKKFLRSFGTRGQRSGEFMCPYGIALSVATEEILITDKWKHCIHVFSRNEKYLRQIGCKGNGQLQFKSPEGICVDRAGTIYICDTINNRIQILDKHGSYLREINSHIPNSSSSGIPSKRQNLFQELTGIAVTADGHRLVVCDYSSHRIYIFNKEGAHLTTCGQKGSLKGQFLNPECVAMDEKGFIFVGDSGNHRVQVLRPDGRFVRVFGSKGSMPGQFSWISGIALTEFMHVFVCDFKSHCITMF